MDIEISRPDDIFRAKSSSNIQRPRKIKIGKIVKSKYDNRPRADLKAALIEKFTKKNPKIEISRPNDEFAKKGAYTFEEDIAVIWSIVWGINISSRRFGKTYVSILARSKWLLDSGIDSLDDLKKWHKGRGTYLFIPPPPPPLTQAERRKRRRMEDSNRLRQSVGLPPMHLNLP